MKNILEAPFMVEMIRTVTNMYAHGWDERNGGNISLMLDESEVREYLDADAILRAIPTHNVFFGAAKIANTMSAEKERKGPAEDALQRYTDYMTGLLQKAGYLA